MASGMENVSLMTLLTLGCALSIDGTGRTVKAHASPRRPLVGTRPRDTISLAPSTLLA